MIAAALALLALAAGVVAFTVWSIGRAVAMDRES